MKDRDVVREFHRRNTEGKPKCCEETALGKDRHLESA